MPGAQPDRERLAVHPRQLAIEPRVQILRRHRRSLLRRMEQTRRATVAHHVHRIARLGAWVLISEGWYKAICILHRDAALSDDEGAFQPRPLPVILAPSSFPDGNANPKPPKVVGWRKNMMLRSVLARVIVSMAGAMPMALTATARAQDLNAYCAKAGNDDRVKPIPAALLPAARRLFNLRVGGRRRLCA